MTEYVTPAGPLRGFVAELVAAGVRDAIVCPGSRSTPLALALRAHPDLRVLVHLDERAAAYFALGLAKAARRPVALLATSGTAVVNFAPAVAEAHHGRVPLVVLTADRPPELRDRGANQAIDQAQLYGSRAKWYAELPVPDGAADDEQAHVRWVAARAVATALQAPAGPVQVNWPFREPLVPAGSLVPDGSERSPAFPVTPALRTPTARAIDELTARLDRAERPVIVVGPLDHPAASSAIADLAARAGIPVLADVLANLRTGSPDRTAVIARFDALLRSPAFRAEHAPDFVLRFGATPTSKVVGTWLRDVGGEQLVVDDGGWNEPYVVPGRLVHADPAVLATELSRRVAAGSREAWLRRWREADAGADAVIRGTLGRFDEPFEGGVFAGLPEQLPDGTILYVGNSMPIRDADAFLPGSERQLRLLGNRGASGIDGIVSSALGAAAAGVGPVVAVVGDLSFVHDMNALVAARLHGLDLTLVVVDNDGGGIFSFLPQASADRPDVGLPAHYEELFGTPHGVDGAAVATALGADVQELEPATVAQQIGASVRTGGIRLLRLRTDRRRNLELHREVTAAVEQALAARNAEGVPA